MEHPTVAFIKGKKTLSHLLQYHEVQERMKHNYTAIKDPLRWTNKKVFQPSNLRKEVTLKIQV